MSPRRPRFAPPGYWFHVGNRAVDRRQLFREDTDYEGFLALLGEAARSSPVECAAFCVMPNHFHLQVRPLESNALSEYMRTLTGRHACDVRAFTRTRGHGHVYQGRFWNVTIASERQFVLTLRYVEANAARAGLVPRAEQWRWSSAWDRVNGSRGLTCDLPVGLPANWIDLVNEGLSDAELRALRRLARRGRPHKGTVPFF